MDSDLELIAVDAERWARELQKHGFSIIMPERWEERERLLALRAVRRMARALGGPEEMRRTLGPIALAKRKTGGGGLYAFWPRPPWMRIVVGEALLRQQPEWLGEVALIHELAHAWDARTANLVSRILGRPGRIVREMVRFVGEEPGPTRYGSGLRLFHRNASTAASEQWAETVAAYLYPEYIAHLSGRPEEREWPAQAGRPEHLRPGLGIRHRVYVEGRFLEGQDGMTPTPNLPEKSSIP
ncbi:MAG: hypothetical protein RML46_08850 [Anaerolineae bacterium]|nr:hypothetical protein [Anaerolineae bacterium]MDW8069006.1 hypothetical protein [Anaerolineae bacterium]